MTRTLSLILGRIAFAVVSTNTKLDLYNVIICIVNLVWCRYDKVSKVAASAHQTISDNTVRFLWGLTIFQKRTFFVYTNCYHMRLILDG